MVFAQGDQTDHLETNFQIFIRRLADQIL